jgi:hypothetical protein
LHLQAHQAAIRLAIEIAKTFALLKPNKRSLTAIQLVIEIRKTFAWLWLASKKVTVITSHLEMIKMHV